MVKIEIGKHKFVLDGFLKHNLDIMKNELKDDFDAFLIMSGRERFGKSTFAGQIATYLDNDYSLKRCVFTPDQFVEAVLNSKKYQAIVFDEAHGYLNVRGSMSRFNRILIKIMAEMGSRNLFIIICLPSFFELDRYPAIHRSTGLIAIKKRGRFGAYGYQKKFWLYVKGRKTFNMAEVHPDFYGTFSKYFVYNKKAYDIKKNSSVIIDETTKIGQKEKVLKERLSRVIKLLMEKNKMTNKEISQMSNIPHQTISDLT